MSMKEMEVDIQQGRFIEAGKYNGHLYGTSVKAIVALAEQVIIRPLAPFRLNRALAPQGKHCVLDVSASAIRRLISAGLHPIVVFLHVNDISIVRQQNPTLNEAAAVEAYDSATKACHVLVPINVAVTRINTFTH